MSRSGIISDSNGNGPLMDGTRMSPVMTAVVLAVSVGCVGLIIFWHWLSGGLQVACNSLLGPVLHQHGCTAGVSKILTYSWAFALLPAVLLLERWRPADPTQPLFSPGLLVDGVWFLLFPLLGIWLPDAFERLLGTSFGPALAGIRLRALTTLPLALQFALVILVSDFLAWFGHYVRHKVPMLWEFHKIHHSQMQLNYFSTRRIHPLDLIAQSLVRFLPWTLLGLSVAIPGYLLWTIFLRLYEMFVHSNIRTNLGWARYIFVTPQGHRVHHSSQPEHFDKNFADFLSIWDFIFRTQCLDFNVCPVLGIADVHCPRGMASSGAGAVRIVMKELVYPLRGLHFGWPKQPATPSDPAKEVSEA